MWADVNAAAWNDRAACNPADPQPWLSKHLKSARQRLRRRYQREGSVSLEEVAERASEENLADAIEVEQSAAALVKSLTGLEFDIVQALGFGKSFADIAADLNTTPKEVRKVANEVAAAQSNPTDTPSLVRMVSEKIKRRALRKELGAPVLAPLSVRKRLLVNAVLDQLRDERERRRGSRGRGA
jgi:vacuolar-type H+-ATPase subunit I/STV1